MKRAPYILLTSAVAVAGCATTSDRYLHYLEAEKARAASLASERAAIAAAAAACRDDRCVEHVAALSALAAAIGGGGGGGRIAPPPPEPSIAEQVARVVGAVAPVAAGVVGYHTTRHTTRAATEQHRVTWETVGDIVRSGWDAMGAVADAAAPRYTIGGDMIGGDRVEIGDHYTGGSRSELTVGRDYTHGDRVDVGGDQVGGDQQIGDRAGRDIVRGSPVRWYSPDHRDGDCRDGADCRQYPPPEDGGGP